MDDKYDTVNTRPQPDNCVFDIKEIRQETRFPTTRDQISRG